MAFLSGKRILITGLLSSRSIAYGIAQACHREGAQLAFTYVGERFRDRIGEFADEFGSDIVLPCDVGEDAQIDGAIAGLRSRWDGLDGLVHSIGFAPREAIAGQFLDGLSRENFRIAHEISAYSFPALAKAALPLLDGRAGSLLTLTYLGAERVVPHYNTMGLAKAALEASVRYLANDLGPRGIRVNGISAGPIKTLASRSARAAWWEGKIPFGLQLCQEGVAAIAGAPESADIALLVHEAARAYHFNDIPGPSKELCQQALEMAERLGQ